jgi:hypothetical protein
VLGADKGTVRISNRGSCEKEPKSYYYCPGKLLCRTLKTNAVRIAPVVNSFTLNKYGSLFLTSALLLTEVRIFSGPYLEKEAKHLCFLVTLADCKWCVNCR